MYVYIYIYTRIYTVYTVCIWSLDLFVPTGCNQGNDRLFIFVAIDIPRCLVFILMACDAVMHTENELQLGPNRSQRVT